MKILATILGLGPLFTLIATSGSIEAVVQTESGPIRGVPEGEVTVFRGIPYAAPPVGDLRWRAPRPVEPWTEVLEAREYGPSCPQPDPKFSPSPKNVSEDCLTLNVWTGSEGSEPDGGEELSLEPVMVWIHGGGYTTGSGSQPYYDGSRFAEAGVVLVTINYRLGPFGFLSHPLLSEESPTGTSGNYGLLDQIAALQWVQTNIRFFGGDPDRVTVFGESAGAGSIGHLLVIPAAEGLFHRAILQSGHALNTKRPLRGQSDGVESAEAIGVRLSRKLGIEDAEDPHAALRAVSAEELLAAADAAVGLFASKDKYGPIVDGAILPAPPAELFAAGRAHDVDLLIGTNATEAELFMKAMPVRRPAGYRWMIGKAFPGAADEVLERFPATSAGEVRSRISEVTTLSGFVAPARRLARWMEEGGREVWLYHFTRTSPGARLTGRGATHAVEIPYVFGGLGAVRFERHYAPRDHALSEQMMSYWAGFARCGDPNGKTPATGSDRLPTWPEYHADSDLHLEFGEQTQAGEGLHAEACDLFDRAH